MPGFAAKILSAVEANFRADVDCKASESCGRAIAFEITKLVIPAKAGIQDFQGVDSLA